MDMALTVAKGLSGLLSAVVMAAFLDIWRRGAFPEVSYGGVTLGVRRLRWLWFASILGGILASSQVSPASVRTTDRSGDPAVVAGLDGPVRTTEVQVAVMFYSYYRTRASKEGVVIQESVQEGVVLPWALISSLLFYLAMVVRWNPESRWAMRILHGRQKAKRKARGDPV